MILRCFTDPLNFVEDDLQFRPSCSLPKKGRGLTKIVSPRRMSSLKVPAHPFEGSARIGIESFGVVLSNIRQAGNTQPNGTPIRLSS